MNSDTPLSPCLVSEPVLTKRELIAVMLLRDSIKEKGLPFGRVDSIGRCKRVVKLTDWFISELEKQTQ